MQTPGAAPLVILGGGAAGLAVAHYAARASLPFDLYDQAEQLGGLCRTFVAGAHRYDCGAHRFHDRDAEITADVRALLGDEIQRVEAPNQVWDRGRFLDFPPTPIGLLRASGPREAMRLGLELLSERLRRRETRSLEDFAVSRFGATLSRRILLNYSEKLWGLPAAQLSPDAATRRLQGLTLTSLVSDLAFAPRRPAHLDGSFLYPRRGYGRIGEAIEKGLPKAALHPQHEIVRLHVRGGLVSQMEFADGQSVVPSGRIVSTLPLPLLVRVLGDAVSEEVRAAGAALRFRHLRLVFLRLARPRVSKNASIYLPDGRFCVSRVCEPKNRSAEMAPPGETSLVAEVPCFRGDATSALPEAALFERVVAELVEVGLIQPDEVREAKHHFLTNAYPVYATGYEEHVRVLRAGIRRFSNLDSLGRGGLFFYSHLHDQMRMAKDYVAACARAGDAPREVA